ncbi:MAG: hypothetical protein ACYTED_20695 [Planctomycetota bacterium]|jgi:hypothetical protein
MRLATVATAATVTTVFLLGTATASPEGWHRTMKDGVAAAKRSGKPVLVVTMWGEKM